MASLGNLMRRNLLSALSCKPFRVGSVIARPYSDPHPPPLKTRPGQTNNMPASSNVDRINNRAEATSLSTTGDNRVRGNDNNVTAEIKQTRANKH